jgi:hypothetical protein
MRSTQSSHPYIVIDAPGFYGDEGGRVYSAHATLESARRAARRHFYTDVGGNRRRYAIVALNEDGRYAKGGGFSADMPPVPVGA